MSTSQSFRRNPDQYVGLSCQCVGAGAGGSVSMLARVSLVNYRGHVIIDCYVQPTDTIVSYRTHTTGIEARHFDHAIPFQQAQAATANALRGKIAVGHSLWTDLFALGISHPAIDTRDVGLFLPFRNALRMPNQVVGLQTLMWHLMRRIVQAHVQDSAENARACIDLFRSHEIEWEAVVVRGQWPCALPPASYSRFFS